VIVETESAIYALDLVSMRLKRFPRDSPIVVENPRDGLPAVVASLRKDTEAIPFEILAPLEVGQPAQFMLEIRDDGVKTFRMTTDVLKIVVTED
jgi:hypothetical protein